MAISNTNILIKRSVTTGRPTSLKSGEFAYSYVSNTLFFGTPSGDGVVNIGGQYYTSTLDAATNANTASTLVKRNAAGAFSGRLLGNANTATVLETGRNFSISGGDISATAQSFDGSSAITLNASLNTVDGLSAGVYGGATAIPVVTVAANGRVMSISNTSISTSFTVAADSGASQTVNGGETLTLVGGAGITSVASADDTVTFNVDDTVVRANGFTGGTQTINTGLTIGANNDLTVTGNLYVFGNTTTLAIDQFEIQDPLLLLGTGNYFTDTFDIGFASHYNDGQNAHTGLIRDAGTKEYHFFKGYTPELDANNNINLNHASYQEANVTAAYFKGNLIATTATSNGFYGNTSTNLMYLYPSETYAASGNQYIVIDPTAPNHIHVRAGGAIDSSTAQLFLGGEVNNVQIDDAAKAVYISANSKASSFNTDGTLTVFGKVISNGLNLNDHTQSAFDKANAAVFSTSTLTNGAIVIGAGTNNVTTLANTTYTLTGSLSAAKTITSLSVDAYGRVTAATGEDIAIGTSQITSGTLGYERGGTGSTSYTTGGLLIAGASGFQSLANTTYTLTGSLGANSSITSLTVDAYGRVTAATASEISGLTVAQGGTGASSFTTNGITYGNGTGAVQVTAAAGTSDQTWSNQILTVTNAGTPVWTEALDGGTF
jgi:hypothetical protein